STSGESGFRSEHPVHCPHCHHHNPAKAKYCLACGGELRRRCAHCRTRLPAQAQFCFECGRPTEPSSARRAVGPAAASIGRAPARALPIGLARRATWPAWAAATVVAVLVLGVLYLRHGVPMGMRAAEAGAAPVASGQPGADASAACAASVAAEDWTA